MNSIQWRPEINALTTPQSYIPRHVPRAVLGNDKLAACMVQRNPLYTEILAKSFLLDLADELRNQLLNGNKIVLDDLFACHLSFTGRLDSPNAPLPPLEQCLHVRFYPSKRLVAAVHKAAPKLQRLAEAKKLPIISMAKDTVSGLNDVLNPQGLLLLIGSELTFDRSQGGECVIEGTQSGRAVQTRFGKTEDKEVIVMPDIPAQPHPWNNEYRVSITTRYSRHGTLRTGTYGRMLRTPLTVHGFSSETGILTGRADTPYVSIIGGTATANETLRVQVVFEPRRDYLLLSLLDMQQGGRVGTAVSVAANGEITLLGFTNSGVTSLRLRVNAYATLKAMVKDDYGRWLVDVLQIEV